MAATEPERSFNRGNRQVDMTTLLINYADQGYYKAQKLNAQTALSAGGVDRVLQFGRRHLDTQFLARNEVILNRPLGAGVWLWKPHIVLNALRHEMSEDDVLFYADSGCHFVSPVKPVVDICLEQTSKPLVMFHLGPTFTNAKYTKRDCFFYMNLDRPPYPEMPQILASFFLCRKNEFTIAFFEEWLRYAQDQRLLTEAPNTCGLPNYPDFVGHRFDQSILSLLARKYGVTALPDISQWGNELRQADIPQIIDHTRWKE